MFKDLELGAIRAHILHHAWRAPVYGSWMLDELERVSPRFPVFRVARRNTG